jgi:hypothetical protein
MCMHELPRRRYASHTLDMFLRTRSRTHAHANRDFFMREPRRRRVRGGSFLRSAVACGGRYAHHAAPAARQRCLLAIPALAAACPSLRRRGCRTSLLRPRWLTQRVRWRAGHRQFADIPHSSLLLALDPDVVDFVNAKAQLSRRQSRGTGRGVRKVSESRVARHRTG